ncbi:MAG: hypothetical protein BKP49_03350 [Treponema sp. CETP13]|nr:MAG: hypothetical protein BKP49_03350 [Treponema sp. CETP13]
MKKNKKSVILKRFMQFFCLILVAVCIFVLVNTFSLITETKSKDSNTTSSRDYHVLVVGSYKNASFLKEVYKGAFSKGSLYNAVVDLLVPASKAEDVPLQTLLNFGGYESVDGIIAYVNSYDTNIIPPVSPYGEKIPLISVGYYDANLPQLSYIGTGYYEMGRIFAREIEDYLNGEGSCLVINPYEKNDPTYSSLMNSLQNKISELNTISLSVFEIDLAENVSIDTTLRQKMVSLKDIDVIVCLSQEITIRTAEAVTDINKAGKIGIIGVQEDGQLQDYLDKGIVAIALSFNPYNIGRTAMDELFEYKTQGSANSYIMSDISILNGKKE